MVGEKSLREKLDESRIIIVNGYVDKEQASDIIFKLLTFSAISEKEDIQLFIGSEGGSYLDMLAIYDTMQSIPNKISGTCVGMADGYATLILASCTKGKRYALKHAEISFEQPYGSLQEGPNQQTEIAIEAKEVATERKIFEELMAKVTSQDVAKIHGDCEVGVSFSAEQALEYGIIDGILG